MAQADSPETVSDPKPIYERLTLALYAVQRQYLKPSWIILGQEEWFEFRRDVREDTALGWPDWLRTDGVPTFRMVPIATVPVAHHFEVVVKCPNR